VKWKHRLSAFQLATRPGFSPSSIPWPRFLQRGSSSISFLRTRLEPVWRPALPVLSSPSP
jgi:hypothetical protein